MDGTAYGNERTIIIPGEQTDGRIVIGYINPGTAMARAIFNYYVAENLKYDEMIGMGMEPVQGKRLSVFGDSYFKGKVGIYTNNPTYQLDVNGSIGGTSLNAKSISSSHYITLEPDGIKR